VLLRGGEEGIGTLQVGSANEKWMKMTRVGKTRMMNNVR